MFLFKKSKDKKYAEKIYSLISKRTDRYTLDQIKETIISEGYNKKVADIVLKKIKKNKLPYKTKESSNVKINEDTKKSKEEILKELSLAVKSSTKKEPTNKSVKDEIKEELDKKETLKETDKKEVKDKKESLKDTKNLETVSKVGFLTKTKNFFKRIYFYFEDIYYNCIDGISKYVPINKITDKIDKKFPSFVIFLILLALLLYLLFSGAFSLTKTWTVYVEVYDTSNTPLSDAYVTLQINDQNISTLKTDIFGEVIFKDFRSKRQNITLIASKKHYNTEYYNFTINQNNLRHKIILTVDTDSPNIASSPAEEREILFVENNDILITNTTLNLAFSCTNNERNPDPRNTIISTGRVKVMSPSGCGSLRVTVTSNHFNTVTNKVIPENNKVVLERKNLNRGTLGFSVKDIEGNSIADAQGIVYNTLNPTLAIDSLTTDIYGMNQFSLEPRDYLLSVSKYGYLTYPRKGPFKVIKDTTVNANFILFTAQDLIDFDCSIEKYKPFCIDGEIDCNNEHLKPFIHLNPDGTCLIGTPGYLDVSLKDSDTQKEVFADIVLDYKLKGSDDEFSSFKTIQNKSNAVFDILDFYNYRVRVVNSEVNGYLQPDPVLIDTLDQNITIFLDFSSELNSGKIKVNVLDDEMVVSNARVYLYREFEDNFILVNEDPRYTDQFGNTTFEMQRANQNYYAYSIHSLIGKEGSSQISNLDVNSTLDLNIDLLDVPKMLNLKVMPNVNYDINFYSPNHNLITEYVTVDVDDRKQYIFSGSGINSVYAIISSQGYASYQTEMIDLIYGEEIFKEINLVSLSNCTKNKIDFLGFYDKTGTIPVENIDFVENKLSDQYQIKFKYTSCLDDAEYKVAHIRAGREVFIDDDVMFLLSENITSNNVTFKRGYMFSGEHVPDFDSELFNLNYFYNQGYDYNGDNYKWVEIDFRDLLVQTIEFSLDIGFKENPIKPPQDYVINYRATETIFNEVYNYDPEISTLWNQVPFYPDGYFYAETNKYQIPFSNENYLFSKKIKDVNGTVLDDFLDGYKLDIGSNYKYDIEYFYISENDISGIVLQDSINTNNNLEYLSYGYISSVGSSEGDFENIYNHISVNDFSYSLADVNVSRGYNIEKYTLLKPNGFFNITHTPSIRTNFFNNNPLVSTNIYAYNPDESFICNIETSAENNLIYIGNNNLTFNVIDDMGNPVENVVIKYQIQGKDKISIGQTNTQGMLNTSVNFEISDLSNNVDFLFIFDSSAGLPNNTIKRTKKIKSGVSITGTPLVFNVNYFSIGNNIITEIENESYKITNLSNLPLLLEDITFSTGESYLFNMDQTNEKIKEINNPIPRNLNQGETNLFSNFILANDVNQDLSSTVNAFFNNIVVYSDEITKVYEAQAQINLSNLGSMDFSIDYPMPNKGVFKDDDGIFNVEIIKDINPEIFFDINISAESQEIYLNDITFSQLPSFIDIISFENSINVSNHSLINPLELNISIKLDSEYSNFPSLKEEFVVYFNFNIDGNPVTLSQIFNVKAYDKDSLVDIEYNIPSNSSLTIFCVSGSCENNKSYNLKKNVDHYQVVLKNNLVLNPLQEHLNVNNLSQDFVLLETFENVLVNYSSNYNNLPENSFSGNTNTIFNFNILNQNFIKEKELSYTINKIDLSDFESDLDDDFCIGVGGQSQGNDLFMLGYCHHEIQECHTGPEALPKVFFNWGQESESWNSKCIGDNLDSMEEKYACDSLQMLISIFYKIQGGVSDPFYIKLLNDGISKELLKDFIDYNPGVYLNVPKPVNEDLFTHNAVDNSNFKIIINNNPNLKVFNPGIYEVRVFGKDNESYNNTLSDEKIEIRITFERNIPSSELTVFHYTPFNGPLNNEESPGYGVNILYQTGVPLQDEILKINPFVDLEIVNKENYISTLILTNNNNLSGYKRTIESDGYILDTRRLPDNFITLEYTPSYPIPLKAHVACKNNNDFSYNLLRDQTPLDNIISGLNNRFLNWDYNGQNLSDLLNSNPQGNRFILNTSQTSENSFNINTMLYLPTTNEIPLNSVIFKTSDFDNNENTVIFSRNNTGGSEDILFNTNSHVLGSDLENISNIKGIFEYVKEGKACIFKSPSRTYIKWNDDAVGFTEQQILEIQDNIPEDYSCQESGRE